MATAYTVAQGDMIPYTPSSAVSAGDVVVRGDIVAVAPKDIAANELGHLAVEGIFSFPKATTSVSALAQGTKVWWNAGSSIVTTSSSGNKVAGYISEAAAASDARANVKLARA